LNGPLYFANIDLIGCLRCVFINICSTKTKNNKNGDSGRIRITFWGDHAPLVDELDIDTGMQLIDAYSKSGFNDEIELSVGNKSRVVVL